MSIFNGLADLLGKLRVSRKLMLIYLLDLTAVIYISGILINEKFIAIDFARKEVQGNAYVVEVRDALLDIARAGLSESPNQLRPSRIQSLLAVEDKLGSGLGSAALAKEFANGVKVAAQAAPADAPKAINTALSRGRDLMTRVGNQSNLILDPDLDSYYTMSQVVLRYPELLEMMHGINELLRDAVPATDPRRQDVRTRFLIIEGRLNAVAQGMARDHAEALAAGDMALTEALRPAQQHLAASIEDFRDASRRLIDEGPSTANQRDVQIAQHRLLTDLQSSWTLAGLQLDRLLQLRIEGLYHRMGLHLGTALTLLLAILGLVTFVARQIARPLTHLSTVADTVRRTGDHTLRAQWRSEDEIGSLVIAFNDMLSQLYQEREIQKELAATARAAEVERALVASTPIALVVTGIPNHEVLNANLPAEDWLKGARSDPWETGLDPQVRLRFFQELQDRGSVDEFEVRWHSGSEAKWAMLSARRMRYQGQDALITAFSPINHLKALERRLQLWAKVFEASGEGILIIDLEQRVLTANHAFMCHTGHELQDVSNQYASMFFSSGNEPGLPSQLWQSVASKGVWQGELCMRRNNGTFYPAWLMASAVRQPQGDLSHYIFSTIDITDRKKSEQRIRFLADHDTLTELPNRTLCIERLRMATQHAQRSGKKVAVLFIDLDGFKEVNDSMGHHVGDGLLRSVAGRLMEAVRAGDTVSRLGGDEFVIVLDDVVDINEVVHVAEQRLMPLVRQPHLIDNTELQVSCSLGIAIYPDDSTDIDELMRQADTAMYQAKAGGKDGIQFFTGEMTQRAQARLQLENRLRLALDADQFFLVYQPRVSAATGELVGVEGLLRWRHPDLGIVSPADFIPIAEETGLIVPIGAWVIEEGCRQIAAWRNEGLQAINVSLNVSGLQLREVGLVDTVREAMARHRVPAGKLELELTESMVMDGAEHHLQQMHALRALGVDLSIDDFGTGYSSLAYLNRFPINKLKIDRSFVHDMLTDATDLALTLAIVELGHTLGLQVVAEGVEHEEEAALLRDGGCDELQGYLIARPMPARDLMAWAQAHECLVA